MIAPTTRFVLARVPLSRIVVTEHQPRYFDRVQHYVRLLLDARYRQHDAGIVALRPFGSEGGSDGNDDNALYTLLDGHHRYCASIICGRADVLALIHYEPGDAGYEHAHTPTTLTHATATPVEMEMERIPA